MDFGLIGCGGYVAPRHMKAIKDTGNELKVAFDLNDSVGILDSYFPDCAFFTQQERFDRHIVKHEKLDFMSICSPNYLHETHCKLGMRLGSNIICEKPLALTLENVQQLQKVEKETNKKIYSILQLRLHPSIIELKKTLNKNKHYNVKLEYITPRGPWYHASWKGKEGQSGGIETNIGIHFFDILIYLFGEVRHLTTIKRNSKKSQGILFLERAKVNWHLSLNRNDLPSKEISFFRNMVVDGKQVNFDNVFSELHTESYKHILNGDGFNITETLKAIELVEKIRNSGR